MFKKIFTWISGLAFSAAIFSLIAGHFEGKWAWINIPYIWEPKLEQAIACGIVSIASACYLILVEVNEFHNSFRNKGNE